MQSFGLSIEKINFAQEYHRPKFVPLKTQSQVRDNTEVLYK